MMKMGMKTMAVVAMMMMMVVVVDGSSCASKTTCKDCVLVSGCGFCQTQQGAYYCTDIGAQDLPANTSLCAKDEDQWYTPSGNQCDDPACVNHDIGNDCQRCLDAGCGYCNMQSGCNSPNPTDTGPWYPFPCNDWRFKNSTSTINTNDYCQNYANCSTALSCNKCQGTYESFQSGCKWCGSGSGNSATGTCLSIAQNQVCSSPNAVITQCPFVGSSSRIEILFSLFFLVGFFLF